MKYRLLPITFGFEATIFSSALAGPVGCVRHRSQSCDVRRVTPINFANGLWLICAALRMVRTSGVEPLHAAKGSISEAIARLMGDPTLLRSVTTELGENPQRENYASYPLYPALLSKKFGICVEYARGVW